MSGEILETDSSTIDENAFTELCHLPSYYSTIEPAADHDSAPATSPLFSPSVSGDFIRTCVTPQKVRGVQETLNETMEPHACALKLLKHFFSDKKSAATDVSHNKET